MTSREQFEAWFKANSTQIIKDYGFGTFSEDVMFTAWHARGELDAKRIAELEAERDEWKEVGLGHDENARQAIKQVTALEAKLAIAIEALELINESYPELQSADEALTKIKGE